MDVGAVDVENVRDDLQARAGIVSTSDSSAAPGLLGLFLLDRVAGPSFVRRTSSSARSISVMLTFRVGQLRSLGRPRAIPS
jgi:hypothetical protein